MPKVTPAQITKNPLVSAREQLGMTRCDLAILVGVSDGFIGNVEAGRFADIPGSLISAMTPYLKEISQTPEGLQSAYRNWRSGLGADVRRRADRYCQALRLHPGLQVSPDDFELIEEILK